MFWLAAFIAAVVILAGSTSFLGSWQSRRDIASGRANYLSLSDRTGIWDRNKLADLFGEPDEDDCYTVSPAQAAELPTRLWQRFFDSMLLDLASIVGAAVSLWLVATGETGAFWLLTICSGYQLVSWAVIVWIVVKHASWKNGDKSQ